MLFFPGEMLLKLMLAPTSTSFSGNNKPFRETTVTQEERLPQLLSRIGISSPMTTISISITARWSSLASSRSACGQPLSKVSGTSTDTRTTIGNGTSTKQTPRINVHKPCEWLSEIVYNGCTRRERKCGFSKCVDIFLPVHASCPFLHSILS